jgi:RNA polymerase sigma-70 factor (ECF subfamily)
VLRHRVLHTGTARVITDDLRCAHRALEAELRPFIARRVASCADADDVLQEVFLRIQRGLPGLRQDDRFGPWVYQVARHAIADHRRSCSRHPLADAPAEDAVGAVGLDADEPDENAVAEQLAQYVVPFVAMLPSPYREALTLTEIEGMTQKDAAAMLGVSLSAMKSRVQRGREKLRALFEQCCAIALDARGRIIACEPRRRGGAEVRTCSATTSRAGEP